MAERDALKQVEEAIDSRQSFLVEAGAGSGKTFALVHGLRHILRTQRDELERRGRRVACITYTNVAKGEISERIADDPLVFVGTIHEFMWSLIENYQEELKAEVVVLNGQLKKPAEGLEQALQSVRIVYSDRGRKLEKGRISHDEVIAFAYNLFVEYPKISRIAADKYPFLFIDEYQDTAPETVELIVEHFCGSGVSKSVVGFFGDSMQKIYQRGVGAVDHEKLRQITKHENFRCSRSVIGVLNQMRPELQQVPAGENAAGEVHFFSGAGTPEGVRRLEVARQILAGLGWNVDEAKTLMLTHRGIAGTLEYERLFALYAKRSKWGRDDLLEGNDPHAQFFQEIEKLCQAYESKDYGEVIRLVGRDGTRIVRHSEKAKIAAFMQELTNLRQSSDIGTVLDFVVENQLLGRPRRLRDVEERIAAEELDGTDEVLRDFVTALRAIPYSEVMAFSRFRDERTPFSTQHGVKGTEYDDVIVVVDDGAWNQYDMGEMMAGTERLPQRRERSRNLFYVCCSRARRGLAVVFLSEPPAGAVETARRWFGPENVR
ncbi:UvrD-helicase domain-containing protein [Lentzea sp. NEAU-D13]|uniref:UvrD-helicase domain-containing protein n=1 Tax=Lentzea alba TaxID=2714351 RepID=A0A7C9W045_9PSEU|nr:UvrD-helicase domain-containing protein [Lentzea alba]NGY65056.1 UvrD-helicase domain-containing protein [Lentzea alba]